MSSRTTLVTTAVLFLLICSGGSAASYPPDTDDVVISITDEGGVGDGKTSNTVAFVRAVAKLAPTGGTLKVPSGVFLTGPFNLTSHMTLLIEEGGTILGSTNLTEWPLMPPMPSYSQGRDHPGPRHVSLIHGFNLTNVVVTGNGTIDGNGPFWWDRHNKRVETHTRGHLIEFMWSSNLEVSWLKLTRSPFWTVHPVYSKGFYAHHLTILNDLHSPNTDGIDPDSTTDVILAHNYISTGDDCYALKSGWDKAGYTYGKPTKNVSIYGGFCESPTSAGICIGSEMSGGVEDVRVWDMTFKNVGFAFRLKSGRGRGGDTVNIDFADSTLTASNIAFEFSEFYGGHPAGGYDPTKLPAVNSVSVHNITGDVNKTVAEIKGILQPLDSPTSMRNIRFEHVHVTGGDGGWECSNVWGGAVDTPGACDCLAKGCPKLAAVVS